MEGETRLRAWLTRQAPQDSVTGCVQMWGEDKGVMELLPTSLFGVTAGKVDPLTETGHQRQKELGGSWRISPC